MHELNTRTWMAEADLLTAGSEQGSLALVSLPPIDVS